MRNPWAVVLVAEVTEWFEQLCHDDWAGARQVADAIDMLAQEGPTLGRPPVDRIVGSVHHHLKELRPASAGSTEIRILFAFDPVRRAVLLVAGDKAGNWRHWYDANLPLADKRYAEHIAELDFRECQ